MRPLYMSRSMDRLDSCQGTALARQQQQHKQQVNRAFSSQFICDLATGIDKRIGPATAAVLSAGNSNNNSNNASGGRLYQQRDSVDRYGRR